MCRADLLNSRFASRHEQTADLLDSRFSSRHPSESLDSRFASDPSAVSFAERPVSRFSGFFSSLMMGRQEESVGRTDNSRVDETTPLDVSSWPDETTGNARLQETNQRDGSMGQSPSLDFSAITPRMDYDNAISSIPEGNSLLGASSMPEETMSEELIRIDSRPITLDTSSDAPDDNSGVRPVPIIDSTSRDILDDSDHGSTSFIGIDNEEELRDVDSEEEETCFQLWGGYFCHCLKGVARALIR